MSRSGRRRAWVDWLLLWLVIGGGATIRTHSATEVPGTVLVVAVTAAFCAVLVRQGRSGNRLQLRGNGTLTTAVALLLVVATVTYLGGVLAGVLVVIGGLAVVVLASVMPRRVEACENVIVRLLRWLLRAASLLAMGAVWCVTIGPAWTLDRLTGWNPVAQFHGKGWVQRVFDPSLKPWSRQRGLVEVTGAVRVRRNLNRGAMAVLTVCAVLAVGVVAVRTLVAPDPPNASSPAMSTSPWYPEVASITQELLVRQRFNSFLGYELPDVTSRYVNVVDGRRRTWQPPAGSCRAVKIWMFGGSTTFGDGQRDEYTIPSQLAKIAWSEGIPVEVSNFAVHGDTAWIESRRLEAALSVDSDEPDLVTFLDGFNEYQTRVEMIAGGHSGDQVAVSYLDSQLFPFINQVSSAFWSTFRPSRYVHEPETEVVTIDDPEVLGQLIGRQYRLGVEASQRLLSARTIGVVWFDQPSVYTLSDPPSGTPLPDPGAMEFGRSTLRAMREVLPDQVVDLTSAMDGERTPIYRDDVHTNERGARAVAQAMFDEVQPALENLCQESERAVDPTQRLPGN